MRTALRDERSDVRPPGTIVMAINEGYASPAACALYSIGDASPETNQVIMLGSDLSRESSTRLHRVAGCMGIELSVRNSARLLSTLGDLPVSGRVTKDVWARLLIPQMCPELDECLYLDADILCVGALRKIFATRLEPGKIVGAVPDVFEPTFTPPQPLQAIAGSQPRPNANTGILWINCRDWIEADATGRMVRYAQAYPEHIQVWDQDAFNAVLWNSWQPLDLCWNTPPMHDLVRAGHRAFTQDNPPPGDLVGIERQARIMHFMTRLKPWLPDYPDGFQRRRYMRVMRAVAAINGDI